MEGEMVINSRRIPNPELNDEEKRKLLKMDKYKPEGYYLHLKVISKK